MIRFFTSLALVIVIGPLSLSCREKAPETSALETSRQALAPADQSYNARGVLKSLSLEKKEAVIEHEAIPQFLNAAGKRVGMPAMTMPFTLGEPALSAAVSSGDKVEFTFEVRWHSEPTSLVTRLTKLPPDTELELR